MGILFAIIALFCWGTGDFLIQKSSRRKGVWFTIGGIGAIGAVVLLPFVYERIIDIFTTKNHLTLLVITSSVGLGVSLLYFEALRRGKISALTPILAFEIPITVFLAAVVIGEVLSIDQMILAGVLMLGIILLAVHRFHRIRKIHIEPGAFLAFFAMIGLGIVNFLVGYTARQTDPLLINWFMAVFFGLTGLVGMLWTEGKSRFVEEIKTNKQLVLTMGMFDTLAWVAYAQATVYIPIAIAASLSESYIALAAILGLIFNKEKLKPHQYVGLVVIIIAATALASVTPG
ncbi:MAG: DMT family transporter [Candidatus Doudnabacteria bacterium]|nr:DMT family transporter [Candidatus Doudnabacteria bacterium]